MQNSYPLHFINQRISRMESKFKINANLANTIQQINIENQFSDINTIQITNQEQNLASIVPNENEVKIKKNSGYPFLMLEMLPIKLRDIYGIGSTGK